MNARPQSRSPSTSGIGPTHYTPGTKMPEQTIGSEKDRQALVDFLARVTQ